MRRFAAKVVVRPGQKKPACVPACLAPKDRDPVDFRIECSNTGQTPIEVSASNRDDVLLIILSAVPPPKQSRYLDRTRDVHIPSSVNPIQSNQQVTDFTSAISAILLSEFEKPFNPTTVDADQKFLANILTNAGPDLPAPDFEQYCRAELQTMRTKRKKLIDSGLLVAFAAQAAARHNAGKEAARAWEQANPGKCHTCAGGGSVMAEGGTREVYCPACQGTGEKASGGAG